VRLFPHARSLGSLLLVVTTACGDASPAGEADPPAEASAAVAPASRIDPAAHRAEVEEWRAGRLARLTAEGGFLSLVGLHWLSPGVSSFGSAADNTLVFPAGAPARMGVLRVAGSQVTLVPASGVELTVDGEALPGGAERVLRSDAEGAPSVVHHGTFAFQVIDRGGRLALRVKDSANPVRAGFRGIDSYPVDPSLRIVARFEPYDPPRSIPIPTVLGTTEPMPSPGRLRFERDGRTYTLDPVLEPGDDDLFVIFGDLTNQDETYGGGRFLYAEPPGPDGTVVLDFNRAYNPPCAFTPYATCPLPPPQNKLALRVEAGERRYGDGHHG
jgi:uncharacterized protein (DUF1684 family)